MVRASKDILFFKHKIFSAFFYILAIQMLLVSLTDKDLIVLADFIQATGGDISGFAFTEVIQSQAFEPVLASFKAIPDMLIIGAAMAVILVVGLAVFFVAGFFVSLILRLFSTK